LRLFLFDFPEAILLIFKLIIRNREKMSLLKRFAPFAAIALAACEGCANGIQVVKPQHYFTVGISEEFQAVGCTVDRQKVTFPIQISPDIKNLRHPKNPLPFKGNDRVLIQQSIDKFAGKVSIATSASDYPDSAAGYSKTVWESMERHRHFLGEDLKLMPSGTAVIFSIGLPSGPKGPC
jgi:hypothetical protein